MDVEFRSWRFPGLTCRESEVLLLCAQGLSTAAIGVVLGLTPATVKWPVGNVLRKLDAHDRVAAVQHARREGWIQVAR